MKIAYALALSAAASFGLATPKLAAAQTAPPAPAFRLNPPSPLRWKSVQMVGGGFVDGIIFHPTAPGVRYCRTDMGGAYRWDEAAKTWTPLLDWVSLEDVNLMGVESIAIDPQNPDLVYLACGTYSGQSNTAILRSSDRGRTFQRTPGPFRMGGNENGRGDGERLVVDPNDGRVLYFGSRQAGLWKSTDRAVTWAQVTSFPDVTEAPPTPPPAPAPGAAATGAAPRRGGNRQARGSGVVWEVFDPRSGGVGQPSQTVYAGVSLMGRDNIYRSSDGGATWQAVPGAPTQYRPNHGVLSPDGTLYVSYGSAPGPSQMRDGGIWKLDTKTGVWADITPEKPDAAAKRTFGYGAVAVDGRRPSALIASTFGHPGGEEIFRSTDAGASWKPIFAGGGTYDYAAAPYVARTPIHWLLDLEIDPLDSNHAMFTTGYGGHETFNLGDADAGKPTRWSVMSRGIEETVALELLSPPQGAALLTAVGDYGGFVHTDLDKVLPGAYYEHPRFGNTNSVACAWNSPNIIVRAGRAQGGAASEGNLGYSLDGGKSWQPVASTPKPDSSLGNLAISADGASWIWTPDRSEVFLTRDRGATWTASTGVPTGTRIVADTVNPRKFYGIALFDGQLFTSTDGGATFTSQPLNLPGGLPRRGGNRFDNRGGQDRIYVAPGKEGDLWVAAFDGLYHSPDSGQSWTKMPGVSEIDAFGFGKAAPNSITPALYHVGVIGGVRGVFRSIDGAASWTRINDDAHQWGLVLQITGDPKVYGRVYVGTHGRGTLYGDAVAP